MLKFDKKNSNNLFSSLIVAALFATITMTIDQIYKYKTHQAGGFYICNNGISFGITVPPHVFWLIFGIIFLSGFICSIIFILKNNHSFVFLLSLGLLFGGALSNGADRLIFGCVFDYISFPWNVFPVFNLADVSIFLGSCLLFLYFHIKNITSCA